MASFDVFPVFLSVWFVLAAFSAIFFWRAPVTVKKRLLPWQVGSAAVLFLGFVWMMDFPDELMLVFTPAVALIMFGNYKMIKFCFSCGRTIQKSAPWARMDFCPRCGSSLLDSPPTA